MELNFLGRDSGFGEKNNSAYYETGKKFVLIDCGFTVFNIAKKKFDFNKYDEIEVIITHLHNDHAGSLSQFILYLWFVFHKKTTVISKCEKIKEYLEITGTTRDAYDIKTSTESLEFIKTKHVEHLDTYGFKLKINGKNILYTSDTCSLEEFRKYFPITSELYIDVSIFGGVHLQIEEVLEELKSLKDSNIDIYLMHLDNKEKIKQVTKNIFFIE